MIDCLLQPLLCEHHDMFGRCRLETFYRSLVWVQFTTSKQTTANTTLLETMYMYVSLCCDTVYAHDPNLQSAARHRTVFSLPHAAPPSISTLRDSSEGRILFRPQGHIRLPVEICVDDSANAFSC
ncbi:hypothetical protein BaRGS_00016293 [Batillaria attramentaria]|uniref:Uncharacterized protein n=1 Tax=Batillaria attramentaria TaxID=370345 RepID=A0ABD0KZA1_9CAEN